MHGHILESVKSAKYLGVTLSADLKWNNHIQQMTSKANKSLSFIRRNLQINSKSVKDRAYKSLLRPKLEYCCSVWDQYTTENIYKIEQVQRRTARYACHRHHNTSRVTEMIQSLDWSTLQERRLKTRLHIFYKIINNKIAVSYDNIIIPSQSRTKIYPFKYHQTIQCNKDSFKFSFFCRTIKDWNKLPEHITNSNSTEIFRERLTHDVLLKTFPHLI
jgi:hypothetical protein